MEDLLVLCENEHELLKPKKGLCSVPQMEGSTLNEWVINLRALEENADDCSEPRKVVILGIQWNVDFDNFQLCWASYKYSRIYKPRGQFYL